MADKVEIEIAAKDSFSSVFSNLTSKLGSGVQGILSFAAAGGVAGAAFTVVNKVLGFFQEQLLKSIQAAADAEEVEAKLNATILSTGRAAEESLDEIDAWADGLQRISSFDGEDIKRAYTAISRFENIKTDKIDAVTRAAMDMSAALGGDLATNAEQIASVLDTGLIPRSWRFSATLKEQIKAQLDAGDSAEALDLILLELNKRYGGQAAADLLTYAGASDTLANSLENLNEAAGQPIIDNMTLIKLGLSDLVDQVGELNLFAVPGTANLKNMAIAADYAAMSTADLEAALARCNGLLKSATNHTDQAIIALNKQAIQTELATRKNNGYIESIRRNTDLTEDQKEALEQVGAVMENNLNTFKAGNLTTEEATVYNKAYTEAILDGKDALDAATAAMKELEQYQKEMTKQIVDRTDWETMYTNAKTATDKTDAALELMKGNLQSLGQDGALVWEGFLAATGKISPAALEQFVRITDTFNKVKAMLEQGIEIDIVVKWLQEQMASITGDQSLAPGGGGAPSADWKRLGTVNGPGTGSVWKNTKTGEIHTGQTDEGWATGTAYASGLFLAGEGGRGGEYVYAPGGATVFNAKQTQAMQAAMGGGRINDQHVYIYGPTTLEIVGEGEAEDPLSLR